VPLLARGTRLLESVREPVERIGYGPRFDDIGERFVEVWGVRGGFGFGPAGSGRMYWYSFEAVPDGAPPPNCPRDEFLRSHGAWFDPVPGLIESTDPAAIEPARPPARAARETRLSTRLTRPGGLPC
jgi:hypothetical protein